MSRNLEPDDRYCHGAPWNEMDVIDPETGEEVTICDCTNCRRNRKRNMKEERDYELYEET